MERQSARALRTARMGFALRAALLAALMAAGCARNPVTGDLGPASLDEQEEIALGESMAADFEDAGGGLLADERIQGYVARVGDPVAAVSDRTMPYSFGVLHSGDANAFALPGGRIYLTAGVLGLLHSERELAAVLAHEVAHVAARHSVRGLGRNAADHVVLHGLGDATLGSYVRLAIGLGSGLIGSVTRQLYSRHDEYEADAIGMRYLARAGYEPGAMVEMLDRLAELPGAETPLLLSAFATHPDVAARRRRAVRIAGNDYPGFASTRGASNDEFVGMLDRLARYQLAGGLTPPEQGGTFFPGRTEQESGGGVGRRQSPVSPLRPFMAMPSRSRARPM